MFLVQVVGLSLGNVIYCDERFSSTLGLLWDKARDFATAKLKDGDVTDTKIRELIVRELNDVKTKLDSLSRKDLLSSCRFLQEGVDLLNVSLGKSNPEVNYKIRNDVGEASRASPSGVDSDEVLSDAVELSRAMGQLKINSDKQFEAAKKRFEDARRRATDAFCNDALCINDKIFAAKLRVVSELLEGLECPENAIIGCLSFLKKLHSLPAIQEIFSVYLHRGIKSLLNKAEREENVKSVMLINYVLYRYVLKLSTQYSCVLTWPEIQLLERRYNPILNWQEVACRKSMSDELNQHPNGLLLNEDIFPRVSAVNSHGDVIVRHNYVIKIIFKNGESRMVELPEPRGEVIRQRIVGIAVDKKNNVYVCRCLKALTLADDYLVGSFVLYILDSNYNLKYDFTLNFLEARSVSVLVNMAINRNNDIIMVKDDDPNVYILENTGLLKQKFAVFAPVLVRNLSVTEQNEIIIADNNSIRVYTEEGNLNSTIEVGNDHKVRAVAFHHDISKIIALTFVQKEDCYYFLCFSKTGGLETTSFFCKRIVNWCSFQISSYPNGPVALVGKRSITFI